MRSAKWLLSYILVAFLGLSLAFMLSFRFMRSAHSQTSSADTSKMDAPSNGDLPPEFLNEVNQSPKAESSPSPKPATAAKKNAAEKQLPPKAEKPLPSPAASNVPKPSEQVPTPSSNAGEDVNAGAVNPSQSTDSIGDGATASGSSTPRSGTEEYVYDPTGRRDPFKPYRVLVPTLEKGMKKDNSQESLEPLQRWDVDRLQVVGILWDVKSPRAMLKDPDGFVYTVMKNTKVGRNNGYIAAIREGEIVVIQTVEDEGTTSKETKILELGK